MPTICRKGIPRAALLAAVAVLGSWPAVAEDEAWRALLRLQLRDTFNCQLTEILYHRNVPVGGKVGLEGRVRCLDQREYDFSRPSDHAKFDIRLCQPAVC